MILARPLFCVFSLVVALAGCATTSDNLAPARLLAEPLVQVNLNPESRGAIDNYRTFAVVSHSEIAKTNQVVDPLVEKHLLFTLRNNFEGLGYRFVEFREAPDFVVTLQAQNTYREHYVPPQTVSFPQWVPGTTTYHDFNVNSFGSGGYAWGTITGTSTTPGYLTTQTYTRPGYMSGAFYPSLMIVAFDAKTNETLWNASATGVSLQNDLRISSQFLSYLSVLRFPVCQKLIQNWPRKPDTGFDGILFRIHTNDGNTYAPVVTFVIPGSPAEKTGIKVDDLIVAINGSSYLNKTTADVYLMSYSLRTGSVAKYQVFRGGKTLTFEVQPVSEQEINRIAVKAVASQSAK